LRNFIKVAGADGLDREASFLLSNNQGQRTGSLFAIQAAAKQVDEGATVTRFQGPFATSKRGDIDIVLSDGTFIEAKSLQLPTGTPDDAFGTIERCKSRFGMLRKKMLDSGASRIKFVYDSNKNVSPELLDWLKSKGWIVQGIPGRGPLS
jgi:hypothetical protein